MATTWPPISGDSFALRRAVTVPARELVTVSSTVPRSTAFRRTGTGSGANAVAFNIKKMTTIPARTASRISHFFIGGTLTAVTPPSHLRALCE